LRLPRHHRADRLLTVGIGDAGAHDPAAVEHHDAVGHGEQFIELGRHQQDRHATVAGGTDMAVDRGDRADVEPARRLGRNQAGQIGQRDLARASTAFCWFSRRRGWKTAGAPAPRARTFEPLASR